MARLKRSHSEMEQLEDETYTPYQPQQRGRQGGRQQPAAAADPAAAAAAAAATVAAAHASKIKMCMQCGTTRTPQWREGPLGPKTLCNACGVKRVRAMKALQQGRGGHSPHGKKGGAASRQPAAGRMQESLELATALQLLAGGGEPSAPPAKRQARATQSGGASSAGRVKRGPSYLAAAAGVAAAVADYDAAAAAAGAPLPTALQKAIAAMAAKGSAGGESNPTDSGEEISWSPHDNADGADGGRPPLSAAAAAVRRQQRHQQQLQRAALAAQANAHLGLEGVGGEARQQLLRELALHMQQEQQAYDAAGCQDDEVDAAANLLSMSAAAEAGPGRAAGPASKAAVRELIASLSVGGSGRQAAVQGAGRPAVVARQRGGPSIQEEELLYLMGPGMQVLTRHAAPEQVLEVVRLNELLAEAQRNAAAADAAVAAVEKILREKRAAAEVAANAAISAAQQLQGFVGSLNEQHGLMQHAAQAAMAQAQREHLPGWSGHHQQQFAMAAAAAGAGFGAGRGGGKHSRVGSITQLDVLAAMQQQQAAAAAKAEAADAAYEPQQQQLHIAAALAQFEQQVRHHQEQQPDAADSGVPSDTPTPGCTPGVSPVMGPAAEQPGRALPGEPLDLNGSSAGIAAASGSAAAADDDELEAAALLGSLHDLAAAAATAAACK